MQIIRIKDAMKKRRTKHGARKAPFIPQAADGARIKALATGCAHCRAMRDNTIEAVRLLGLPESELECISDIARISQMGIMSTPSLIIDGYLMSSGKVLSVEQIEQLIKDKYCETNNKE